MSTPRSVPVKRRLTAMMAARFPDFLFTYEWQNTYGFVRQNPGRLYDYLLIGRNFEEYQAGWRGYLGVGPPGRGYNPDWYAWTTGDPWRRGLWSIEHYEDILYQQDGTAFIDDALEQLAERILSQLEALEQSDPDRWEALRRWQKSAARKNAFQAEPPEEMARWYREVQALPGFHGEYERSPILRSHIFNWFTHAMQAHP